MDFFFQCILLHFWTNHSCMFHLKNKNKELSLYFSVIIYLDLSVKWQTFLWCRMSDSNHFVHLNPAPFLQSTAKFHSVLLSSNQQSIDRTKSLPYISSFSIFRFTWIYSMSQYERKDLSLLWTLFKPFLVVKQGFLKSIHLLSLDISNTVSGSKILEHFSWEYFILAPFLFRPGNSNTWDQT